MEKTNSNIPTPEELKAYIDESVISVTGTYEHYRDSRKLQRIHRKSQKQKDFQCLGYHCGCTDKRHGAALPCLLPRGQKEDPLH